MSIVDQLRHEAETHQTVFGDDRRRKELFAEAAGEIEWLQKYKADTAELRRILGDSPAARMVIEIETLREQLARMGAWPPGSHKAFVLGAKWWQFHRNGSTAFASEQDEMEAEAIRRFGQPPQETSSHER